MCGIWGFIPFNELTPQQMRQQALQLFEAFMTLQVRGPDRSDFREIREYDRSVFLGFHRLAIMDKSSYGDQPFTLEFQTETQHKSIYVICNGEIYNYQELSSEHKLNDCLRSSSDCEVLSHVYARLGFKGMLEKLRGEFAICVIDIDRMTGAIDVFIGRDQTSVRPMFFGHDSNGFAFSSILKGIVNIVDPTTIRQLDRAEIIHLNIKSDKTVLPTIEHDVYHFLDFVGINKSFYPNIDIDNDVNINDEIKDYVCATYESNGHSINVTIPNKVLDNVRSKFIEAVTIRLKSDRPMGALLSGGLDSSLETSIAAAQLKQNNKTLRTFSIGIPGSTDKEYAEMVATHCGTDHTHVEFTEQEFLDAISEVIEAIESYDITTVRASVGQYLISKWIKNNTNIRVLLIGDGSDELCAGYMYFHNAPTPEESHFENVRLLKNIHYYDSLRADRCIAFNGIEARVPFLDHQFVDLYLSIPYEYRIPLKDSSCSRRTEKWLLRKSFDTTHDVFNVSVPFLPKKVLWRKKEAFSDGVSSRNRSWYQIIQTSLESVYSDEDFKDPDVQYHMAPLTKEALHYRKIFNKIFHPKAAGVIPFYWMPKWSGDIKDPSARVLAIYDS